MAAQNSKAFERNRFLLGDRPSCDTRMTSQWDFENGALRVLGKRQGTGFDLTA
jgi:hypothetical protein